jgi:chaperonin GroEL
MWYGTKIVTHSAEGTAAGYDVRTETVLEDMVDAGIVDPVKVTRIALEKAASVAGTMITTECVMTDIKKDNPVPAQPQMPMM